MEKLTLKIGGMTCAACSANVQKAVSKLDGISFCEVNIATDSAKIEYDPKIILKSQIEETIKHAGYYVIDKAKSLEIEQLTKKREIKQRKIILTLAFIFTIPLFYLAMAPMITFVNLPYPSYLNMMENPSAYAITQLALCIPVIVAGYKFYTNGYMSLFRLKPNMDSLVAVSTTAAFLYSLYSTVKILQGDIHSAHRLYFESVAVIITLILFGKFLETRSKGKTSQAIQKLMSLSPKTATIIKDGAEITVQADDVVVNDIVIIKPGESMPVDGIVQSGHTSVDESMLTGESMPVEKQEGDKIYAATINKNGSIIYKATGVGEETALSKIIHLVEDAAGSKAPIAKLADVISGYFTPIVMVIALVSAICWYIYNRDIEFALTIFISVLVIACPCALGLATPTAIIVGTGKAASLGILFKNATALQATHQLNKIIFDKTGTITKGKPQVSDIITYGIDEAELIKYAASLEKLSEHPLAQSIVSYAKEKEIDLYEVSSFQSATGHGVEGFINNKSVKIGNKEYILSRDDTNSDVISSANKLAEEAKTPMLIEINNELKGIIAVADVIKETSIEAIKELNAMGIDTIMVTGDNQKTADAIAKIAGIHKVKASVLPEGKVDAVKEYKDPEDEKKLVAMVGDGINDAPALTAADVGIAVGSGTDVAIESADVILVKNDLNDLVTAIKLSHKVMNNIKQNLFWAFCYNTLGIPIAAGLLYIFGGPLLNPMIAAAAMSLSSVSVVTNALRLNNYK